MRRRTWLLGGAAWGVTLVAGRPVVAGGTPRSDRAPPTGPLGGLLLAFGAVSAEVVLWETEVEIFVYNSAGKPLDAAAMTGTVRVLRGNQRQAPHRPLTVQGDHLRAVSDLEGAKTARVHLRLKVGDQIYKGVVNWDRSRDRGRLDDRKTDDRPSPTDPDLVDRLQK